MLVLCYHKVCNVSNDWNNISIPIDSFYEQMKYIKNNFNVIELDKIKDNIDDENAICITFDDRYDDCYKNVLPIIDELNIPITIFISTKCIDTLNEDWCNEISYLILQGFNYPFSFVYQDNDYNITFKTKTIEQRKSFHKQIEKIMMCCNQQTRTKLLNKIRKWSECCHDNKRNNFHMLNKKQIQILSKNKLVTIGAHTVNHPLLGSLSVDEQKKEINGSLMTLKNIIKQNVNAFAYPFGGRESYSLETIKILKKQGIDIAFTTTYKRKNKNFSLYEIPRVCINESNLNEFIEKINLYKNKKSYYYSKD